MSWCVKQSQTNWYNSSTTKKIHPQQLKIGAVIELMDMRANQRGGPPMCELNDSRISLNGNRRTK